MIDIYKLWKGLGFDATEIHAFHIDASEITALRVVGRHLTEGKSPDFLPEGIDVWFDVIFGHLTQCMAQSFRTLEEAMKARDLLLDAVGEAEKARALLGPAIQRELLREHVRDIKGS